MAIQNRKLDDALLKLAGEQKKTGPVLSISKDIPEDMKKEEKPVAKRITREEAEIDTPMNPTIDKIADTYVQGMTGGNATPVRMKGIDENRAKTVDLIKNYDEMLPKATSPELKQKITEARTKLQKQVDYYDQYKEDYSKVSIGATLPTQLAAGLLSLVTGGALVKEVNKRTPSLILNTFKNNTKLATMLSKGNQFGLTFGSVEMAKEGVKQATETGFDPLKLLEKGAVGYGAGALTGGPTGQFGKGIKGALKEGGYQGLAGAAISIPEMVRNEKGWEKDMALNFAVSSLFGLLANKGVTRDVRQQAVRDTKKAVADINAQGAEMTQSEAYQKASQDIDNLIRESTSIDDLNKAMDVIDENAFYKMTDKMKEYKNILSQEKSARIKQDVGGDVDMQMFGKDDKLAPKQKAKMLEDKTRKSFLKSEYANIKGDKSVDPILKDLIANEIGALKRVGKDKIKLDNIEPKILANVNKNFNMESKRLGMSLEALRADRRVDVENAVKQSRLFSAVLDTYTPKEQTGTFPELLKMMSEIGNKISPNTQFTHPAFKRDISFRMDDNAALRTEFPVETLVYIPAHTASTKDIIDMMNKGVNMKALRRVGATIDTPFATSGTADDNSLVFILNISRNKDIMLPIGAVSDGKFIHTKKDSEILADAGKPLTTKLPTFESQKKGLGFQFKKAMFNNREDIKKFEEYVNSKVAANIGMQVDIKLPSNVAKVTKDMPNSQLNILLNIRGLDDTGKLTGKPLIEIFGPIAKMGSGKAQVEANLDMYLRAKGEKSRIAEEEFDNQVGPHAAENIKKDVIEFNSGILRDLQNENIFSKDLVDQLIAGMNDGTVGLGGIKSTIAFAKKALENKANIIMNNKTIEYYNNFKSVLPKGDIVEVQARSAPEINNIDDINKALEPYADQNTIRVFDNGKVREYRIKDLDLYNAIANVPSKIDNLRSTSAYKIITSPFKTINQLARDVLIGISLAFPIKDFVRNVMASLVNSKAKPDLIAAAKSTFTKIDNILAKQSKNETLTPEESALLEYFWLGGDTSMMTKDRLDIIGTDKGVLKKVNDIVGTPMSLMRKPGEKIQEAMDKPIRKTEYVSLRKEGRDKYDAMAASKDVNIDWSEKGDLAGLINDNILFLNAAMKGLQKLSAPAEALYKKLAKGQPLTQDESVLLKKFLILSSALIAAEVAQNTINNEVNPDGYVGIPDYEKNAYIIFMTDDGYVRIPKSQEYGILPNIIAGAFRPEGDLEKPWFSKALDIPANIYEQLSATIPAFDDSFSAGAISAFGNVINTLRNPNRSSSIKVEDLPEWTQSVTRGIKDPAQRANVAKHLNNLTKELIQKKGISTLDNISLIVELAGEGKGEEIAKIVGENIFGGIPKVFNKEFDPMRWKSDYIKETMNVVNSMKSTLSTADRLTRLKDDPNTDDKTKNLAERWLADNSEIIDRYQGLSNMNSEMELAYKTMQTSYKTALDSYKKTGNKEVFKQAVKAASNNLNIAIKNYLTNPDVQLKMKGKLGGATDEQAGRPGL